MILGTPSLNHLIVICKENPRGEGKMFTAPHSVSKLGSKDSWAQKTTDYKSGESVVANHTNISYKRLRSMVLPLLVPLMISRDTDRMYCLHFCVFSYWKHSRIKTYITVFHHWISFFGMPSGKKRLWRLGILWLLARSLLVTCLAFVPLDFAHQKHTKSRDSLAFQYWVLAGFLSHVRYLGFVSM